MGDWQERIRRLREEMNDDRIDEIVKWQLTGALMRKAPVARKAPQPRCHRCWRDWHGLPHDGCQGSFDTPGADARATITDSQLG
jgi:hypothetical protein